MTKGRNVWQIKSENLTLGSVQTKKVKHHYNISNTLFNIIFIIPNIVSVFKGHIYWANLFNKLISLHLSLFTKIRDKYTSAQQVP